MKAALKNASNCQGNVVRTVRDESSMVHIVFSDQSEFIFHPVVGSPQPVVDGQQGSLASLYFSQARKFTYLAAGVMIQFDDGSSCSLNFGKRIALPSAIHAPATA